MRTKEGNKEIDILEAAIRVFAAYGYHNSKMHKIAEEAGVAIGSVYIYYKNKETILFEILRQVWEKLYTQFKDVVSRTDIPPLDKFDLMIDLLFDTFNANPSLAIVFVNEQFQMQLNNNNSHSDYYDKFLDLGENVVREGIDLKQFDPSLETKIFRLFVLGGLRQLLHQWAQSPESLQLNMIRKNVKYIVKHGLLKNS